MMGRYPIKEHAALSVQTGARFGHKIVLILEGGMFKRFSLLICFLLFLLLPAAFAQEAVNCFPAPGTPELELITLINNWLVSQGLFPLAPDPRLHEAAQLQAQDITTNGFCSRMGSDGSTFEQRIRAQGYDSPSGELNGCGYPTATVLMDAWLADGPHRDILLMTNHRHLGVGLVNNNWVLDLGMSTDGPTCGGTNVAPILSRIGHLDITEGHLLVMTITASDANGDALTFAAAGLPAFAAFLDNGNGSATLTLSPPTGTVGTFENIILTVSDGNLVDSEVIAVTVSGNMPPVLAPIGNVILMDGTVYSITVSATDSNGDNILLTASGLPPFAAFCDNGNGTASLTLAPPNGTVGTYNKVSFTASDGMLNDSIEMSITVTRLCFPEPVTPELELIRLINIWRGTLGLVPLASDARLRDAAQLQAQYLATNGLCTHEGPNGSTYIDRIKAQGYDFPSGELQGCGYPTATMLMDTWVASEMHRNILTASHRHLGVGLVNNNWVVDFGASADGASCTGLYNLPPIANAGQDQSGHVGLSFNLDGSASQDPDEHYPLTYLWTVLFAPPGSTATIQNPTNAQPSLTPDIAGTYTIQLIVTDNLRLASEPDAISLSTSNTAPIAEAGPDQAIAVVDTSVELDGAASYDPDGDDISFQWLILSKPAGSSAALSSSVSPEPTFKADIYGDYEVQLIVRDKWSVSNPDIVKISFNNVAPVAVAGGNQAVLIGATVTLDGGESYDANYNSLTYRWNLVSRPEGSVAALSNEYSAQTGFLADKAGNYVIRLVANDGYLDSDPCIVTVTVIVSKQQVVDVLIQEIAKINALPESAVQNSNMLRALTNKISVALKLIDEGKYGEALEKLRSDVLQKMDGCANSGSPDKNDWITDCDAQGQIYLLTVQAIGLLEGMI
jgi:uncharacterized protein YkwD